MIAVIFESWPALGKMQTYLDMGAKLGPQLEKMDGFISIERFQSFSDPTKLLALSIWRDEAAVEAFRNWEVHRGVQKNSRKDVFIDYRLRVAAVLRDYGMTEREQAPVDSRAAHA
ncbi:MAG: antibiotic biosynthesis monooxygenase [Pseudomonadota bacterium]